MGTLRKELIDHLHIPIKQLDLVYQTPLFQIGVGPVGFEELKLALTKGTLPVAPLRVQGGDTLLLL
jgi:hypothetical protein